MDFHLVIDPSKEESVLITAHKSSPLIQEIEALIKRYEKGDTVIGYAESEFRALSPLQMECVFIENGKTYVLTSKGERYLLKHRLYELEELYPHIFIKINKSAIGRLECIERFKSTITGAIDAVFKCGHVEYVSRRCFPEIKRRLEK